MTNPSNQGTDGNTAAATKRKHDGERPRSLAVKLLDCVLAPGQAPVEQVAAAMMVREPTLDEYRRGRVPIPIEAQILLAAFAIERVPKYARLGYQLRGTLRARIAFAAGETKTHLGPPPSARW